MTELTSETQAVVDAYEQTIDKYAALAAAIRVIADELSYTIFMPNNDVRVVETQSLYELADELENLND
jgi:hypothetical protein